MHFRHGAFHATAILLCTAMASGAAAQSAPSPNDSAPSRVAAAPAATSYPTDAAGDGATGGGYNPSRWAEDWRRYRDPVKRDDPLDRLKYLPLNGDGDAYLTLSGEFRTRVNLTTNPGLRKLPAQRQDIYRIFVGADLHLGDHFRVFGELARGAISGPNIGVPVATLRNDLFLQQLFAEVRGDVGGVGIGARYGRQEFVDGANLLTANRDNNTLRFTLNGLRVWARGTRVRADAFDFQLTQYGDGGIGDDIWDPTRRFSGVTTGIVLPKTLFGGSRLYLDPFAWRLRNRAALWGTTTAREERVYMGARLWGEAGPVTLDWTVNHQAGKFDARALDAWQLFFAQTYRLGKSAAAPRIGFHADYATGGGGYGNGTLRNATAPFGNNIYYSYGLFLTPTNLIAIAPSITVSPTKALRVTPEFQWTWRQTTADAIYRANGTAYAGTQLTTSKRTAQVARVQVVWTIAPRISFTGRLEHLFAGPGLTQAGYRDSSFAGGWFSFRL